MSLMEKQPETTKARRNVSLSIPAAEKCRAVLAVWTERRKPAAVCRELGVKWTILKHWQDRALEGMLQALEPRRNVAQGTALSPRLRALLERREKSLVVRSEDRLESRLSSRTVTGASKPGTGVQKTATDVVDTPQKG
jgi:transposase-like protein